MTMPALSAASVFGLPPAWEQLLGRLHPSLVHFPVALLLVALVLEAWGVRKRGSVPSGAALPVLVFGALGAVLAAGAGWLLGDYDDPGRAVADLLFWHRWLGVAVAALSSVAALLAFSGRRGSRPRSVEASRFLLCFCAVFVALAGHLGGSMVHGRRFLSDPLATALGRAEGTRVARGEADGKALDGQEGHRGGADGGIDNVIPMPIDFATQVQPIFAAHCTQCHGPSKTKGDLRLDQRLDEGDTPFVIIPGDPDGSEMIKRVSLPHDDFDIMPAKGEPLTPEEIGVLRRWIRGGALWGSAGGK